jgi:hypothetical protein
MTITNVVQIKDFLPPPQRSQYELYPLPFFNRDKLSTCDVRPTGKYGDDCETEKRWHLRVVIAIGPNCRGHDPRGH